jgi:DNA (cytosine-5)-methyltransferase 1
MKIFNHISSRFSDLEWEMVKNIPPGGNWQNIPVHVPSQRLAQIRKSGGRTTYYGRLLYDKPSYTISTYFNRMGNGCYIHPAQDRLISIREGARLQSFRDAFIFYGTKTSQYKQVGNAVPPLLARVIAKLIEPHLEHKTFIDLFAGAGGMSEGFIMQDFSLLGAIEKEKHYFETFKKNHTNGHYMDYLIEGDITDENNKKKIIEIKNKNKIGVIIGGPPCQGFSTAGWRNKNDTRNQLFKDFVDIVREVKPEFFVMENVPGMLSMRKGEAVKEIFSCFDKIKYHINDPITLKAEEYGVPQRRRRVFIIGSRGKTILKPPTPLFANNKEDKNMLLFKSSYDSLPIPITVREAIGGLPPIKAGEGEFEVASQVVPTSKYEEFLMDRITFEEFYNFKRKKKQ